MKYKDRVFDSISSECSSILFNDIGFKNRVLFFEGDFPAY